MQPPVAAGHRKEWFANRLRRAANFSFDQRYQWFPTLSSFSKSKNENKNENNGQIFRGSIGKSVPVYAGFGAPLVMRIMQAPLMMFIRGKETNFSSQPIRV
jgi:hypothetical protein